MILQDYQKAQDLTLEELRARLGLASTGHTSDLVHRRRGMPIEVAKRFADLIGAPWPEVFEVNRKAEDSGKARAA